MYAVYHGPHGLRAIAERVHHLTGLLAAGLVRLGHSIRNAGFFDTLTVRLAAESAADLLRRAEQHGINLRAVDARTVGVALDETVTRRT